MRKFPEQQKTNKAGWDLFNPIPNFNFMKVEDMNLEYLDNPYIQVVWEDFPENITQEKLKSVKYFFQQKYNSSNVTVITKTKHRDDVTHTIDVSVNIMDSNYQKTLVDDYLNSKGLSEYSDSIQSLNVAVEEKMILNNVEVSPFKKWYVKNIEFSNFLSYGENQKIDFDKCHGITVIESDPPNFGGKTVLAVDLLLFLFFNTTTKTQKSEEIFNRFTDKNVVSVKGNILIDGDEYIIVRKLERKKSKTNDWTVKTDLEFFKKLPNGELQNFTGEQRRETEQFIKTSIGDIDDFLMTILTTSSNLEDLLESKPTARGQVLSRFLGLEFLKKKEDTCKEIYSEFSRGMLSNIYNRETLKGEIDECNSNISTYEFEIEGYNKSIIDVNSRIETGQEYKDNLLKSKYLDIDKDLMLLNPDKLQVEIGEYEISIKSTMDKISSIDISKPSEFYDETEHDSIRDGIRSLTSDLAVVNNIILTTEALIKKYDNGIQCEHCGIKLIEAEITKSKINELSGLKESKLKIEGELSELKVKDDSYIKKKKEFDDYEKNKLIKEKYELTLESNKLKLEQCKDKLKKYSEVQDKVKRNNEIDTQLIKASLRLDQLINERRDYERKLITKQSEISNLKLKIERNFDFIKKIEEESDKDKIYKIYLDVYGKNGISKLIMKSMLPIINSELQRLLEDSCYFTLEVRINDKNEVEFIMIDNTTGIEKLMTSGSGYEKTISSMALRAVLSKVCSLPKPNIQVWDEVFGKISNDNLELVGEFFAKMKDYFEKILVISHNPMINNWGNTMIKVKKIDNISKVIQ